MATMKANGRGIIFESKAAVTPLRATTPPTDKSRQPATIKRVTAELTINTPEIWRSTLVIFVVVKNRSLRRIKTMISADNAARLINIF